MSKTGNFKRITATALFVLCAGVLFTLWTAREADARMRQSLLTEARLAAQGIDTEALGALTGTEADIGTPLYLRLKGQLARLRQAAPDCRFAYLTGRRPDGTIFFYVDNQPAGSEDESPAGQVYEEASDVFRGVFASGREDTEGPTADRWGTWISAFIPLRNPDSGTLIAVFGMDVDARDWRASVISRCWLPVGLLVIALLTGSFSLALVASNRRTRASREKLEALESIVVRGPGVLFLWRAIPGTWPVELVSSNVERILGHSVEDLVSGRSKWMEITHPDDLPKLEAGLADCLAGGSDEWSSEFRLFDSAKRVRWVRCWNRAVRGADAVVSHVQAIVLDVTDQKRAEAEKDRLQTQLVQAQKMELVGRLAGGVAHDFNNLLMGITGYVDLCRQKLEPDHPIRPYLDEVTKDAKRSADLTRQLLAFARKQIITPTIMNLNDAVEDMLKLLRRLVGEGIHMAWAPGPGLWLVKMDRSQLEQLLGNLVVNARDAIPGVGKVTIETANEVLDDAYCVRNEGALPGEYVRLTVSDSGCGMDSEALAHLFEPFFTTKRMGKGTGLGLATVFGIVKQNKGYIEVASRPGEGTVFRIYLPRCEHEANEPPAPPVSQPPRGAETILLAEDEKSPRVTIRNHLEGLGYEVLVAENPAKALDIAREHPGCIELLVTDVVMPGMSGRDLADRVCKLRPDVKCLFMSGYTADVVMHHGVLEGSVAFLSKPFTRDELARKVREVLEVV